MNDDKQLEDIIDELKRVKEQLKDAEEALKEMTTDGAYKFGVDVYYFSIMCNELAHEYFEKWKSE